MIVWAIILLYHAIRSEKDIDLKKKYLYVLIGVLVTIGLLTRNSELVVMRACGISLYRTAVPLVLLGVAASAALFFFEERVLPYSNRRAEALNHVIRGGSPQTFGVIVALVMTAVAIMAFIMFLPIFRDQFLPMARDIERGEFGKKPAEQKSADDAGNGDQREV